MTCLSTSPDAAMSELARCRVEAHLISSGGGKATTPCPKKRHLLFFK